MKFTFHSQISFLSVFISIPSPGSSFELPLVSCSGKCESNCCRFLEARCLCATLGHWAWPSGMHPLGKKKADLLSLSFSSLLMIPSLSFWEDLSSPLTPVRRGRLKQLKVPSVSRLAKESSRDLLGNAKRQGPQFSVHLEGRSHPSTISLLIYFIEATLPPTLTCQCHRNRHIWRAAEF